MNPALDTAGRALALVLVIALEACGGSTEATAHAGGSGRVAGTQAVVPGLFALDGRPNADAQHPPAGFALRTRAGLYATPEQVAWEALTVEPYTVRVDVDAHGSVEQTIQRTLADRRWSEAGELAAFYVSAAEPQRAVAVADALTAAGVQRVFMVVQP